MKKNIISKLLVLGLVVAICGEGSVSAYEVPSKEKSLKDMRKEKKKRRKDDKELWQSRQALEFVGALAAAGLMANFGEKFLSFGPIDGCFNAASVSAKDFNRLLQLSATFYGLAALGGNKTELFNRYAWRLPIIGLEGAFITSKPVRGVLSFLPFIGNILGAQCSNEQCTRLCNQCMLTNFAVLVATYKATEPLIDWASDKIGKKIDYIYHDYCGFERSPEDDYDDYDDYE